MRSLVSLNLVAAVAGRTRSASRAGRAGGSTSCAHLIQHLPGLGERSEIAWLSARVTQCVTDVRGVNEASYEVMTGVSSERSERWQLWL